MTKRERGRAYYKKAMNLYGRAFDNEGDMHALRMEVNRVWHEVEEAEESGFIFKKDAELCYKHMKEAFRWIKYHQRKGA